jgi:hypothetical protein
MHEQLSALVIELRQGTENSARPWLKNVISIIMRGSDAANEWRRSAVQFAALRWWIVVAPTSNSRKCVQHMLGRQRVPVGIFSSRAGEVSNNGQPNSTLIRKSYGHK